MYTFYCDPGHAWLKVPYSELTRLGIEKKVSRCSYWRGEHVYLEEDCDAPLFVNAKGKLGETFAYKESFAQHSSRIRTYEHYSP